MNKILILLNIRSVHNVGSLFRTADASGVEKIYLIGITPAPLDRFGRERKDFYKVSLGAEKSVLWEQEESIEKVIEKLKKEKFTLIALEQTENSIFYKKYKAPKKSALVLGPEVEGIDKKTLSLCDVSLEIPMKGKKESLNVSVAGGIALFHLFGE